MPIKNGVQTSELWLTVALTGINGLTSLLVFYGIITTEEREVWLAVLIPIITNIANAIVVTQYIRSRESVKVNAMKKLESAGDIGEV